MERYILDLRASLRGLRRSPGLVVIAVAALAMGIGFTTTMFSIVHGGTRNLPFDQADRLVVVEQTWPEYGIRDLDVGPFVFTEWARQQSSFEGLGAYRVTGLNISSPGERPIRESGAFVTPNTFALLREPALIGRSLNDEDARPGAERVTVLSFEVWRNRFAGDPAVLGSSVRLNGEPHTIVGVMPEGFGFPVSTELWVPLVIEPGTPAGEAEDFRVFGRLLGSTTVERATVEMATIAHRLSSAYPVIAGREARVYPFVDSEMEPSMVNVLYLMVGAVSFVLLIACANVANLLLARAATRTRDVAIRTALGASRRRIVIQHLAESTVLAAAGGLIGLAIAYIGVGFFARSTAGIIDAFWMEFRVDPIVVAFASGLAFTAALLAGTMPAIRASAADALEALKDQGHGTSSLRIGRLSRGLVVTEIALACGLLVMTLVLTGSAIRLRAFEFPFSTDDVFTARLGLAETHTADLESLNRLLTDVNQRISAIAGVRAAALMTALPGRGAGNWRIRIDDEPATDGAARTTGIVRVTPDFLDVLGAAVVRGRSLTWQDGPGSQKVAVVNESFVERHSADRDPIGRVIHIGQNDFMVVGVVPDLVVQDIEDKEMDGAYISLLQYPAGAVLVAARTSGSPLSITEPVRDAVASIDPDLPLLTIATLHDAVYEDKGVLDAFGTLFFVFGAGALLLTVIGLYGVVSFAVNQRKREIGIRVALGASRRDVFGLVLRQGSRQLAIGVAIGAVLAYALSQVLAAGIEPVEPAGPLALLSVIACLAGTSLVALVVPARHALRVQPVSALRDG